MTNEEIIKHIQTRIEEENERMQECLYQMKEGHDDYEVYYYRHLDVREELEGLLHLIQGGK